MSVLLTNGHVLFPHFPDWRSELGWQRRWETSIPAAVTGKERRHAHRARPLLGLTFNVTARSINEQPQIEDRIRAAIKLGKAAIPYWGRGATLATTATGTSATILAGGWIPQAGDYVFFADPTNLDLFESALVQSVAGLVLTLQSALSRTYPTGELCWPMLFGRITADSEGALTGELGERKITFTETTSTNVKGVGGAVNSGAIVTQTYLGRQIFNFAPNWLSAPTKAFSYDLREVQNGFGATVFDPAQSWVIHGYEVSLELATAADILLVDSFTGDTVLGRKLEFWMPSPIRALEILPPYSGSPLATQFLIRDQNFADSFADNPELHLYFTKEGQTPQVAKVASVVFHVITGGISYELVTMTTAMSPVVYDATWACYRLHLCRLAEDVEKATFRNENHQSRTVRVVEVPNDFGTGAIPLAHWKFDETSNNVNALDAAGSYPLFNNANTGHTTGQIGGCRTTSSTGVFSQSNPIFDGGDKDFAFTGWVKPIFFLSKTVLSRWNTGSTKSYWLGGNGTHLVWKVRAVSGTIFSVTSTVAWTDSAWHYVAVWHDSINDVIGISVNGETDVTTSVAGGVTTSATDLLFALDAETGGTNAIDFDSWTFWDGIPNSSQRSDMRSLLLDYPFPSYAGGGEQTTCPKWLYQFTLQTASPVSWNYTSDERDYTDLSFQAWTAKPINHSGFRRTIQADAEDVTLDAFMEAGHPLSLWLPYPPSAKMKVEIFEDVGGIKTLFFTGYVLDVGYEGMKIKAKCSSWLSELDRKVPRISFQPRCNYYLFETSCGLARAAYQVNGTIFSITGNVVTVDLPSFLTVDPNYFNRGEIQFGSGATYESRSILKAVLVSGIRWTLTLNLPFAYAATSGAIKVWPGCDGLITTCDAKFGNKLRFGGFPHIPTINPVIKPIQPKTTSPKK